MSWIVVVQGECLQMFSLNHIKRYKLDLSQTDNISQSENVMNFLSRQLSQCEFYRQMAGQGDTHFHNALAFFSCVNTKCFDLLVARLHRRQISQA